MAKTRRKATEAQLASYHKWRTEGGDLPAALEGTEFDGVNLYHMSDDEIDIAEGRKEAPAQDPDAPVVVEITPGAETPSEEPTTRRSSGGVRRSNT